MKIDRNGKVIDHEIFESVINSKERMTYADVYKIIEEKDEELSAKYAHIVPMLNDMADLAANIEKQNEWTVEPLILILKNQKFLSMKKVGQQTLLLSSVQFRRRLIEEFMLAANETIAEHFHWLQVPFIYRIHENPKAEKLQKFFEFLTNFGVVVKGTGNDVHPRALQEIVESIARHA